MLFEAQSLISQCSDNLATDPINQDYRSDLADAVTAKEKTVVILETIPLAPVDLLKNFKRIDAEEVCTSNRFYIRYEQEYLVDNLA